MFPIIIWVELGTYSSLWPKMSRCEAPTKEEKWKIKGILLGWKTCVEIFSLESLFLWKVMSWQESIHSFTGRVQRLGVFSLCFSVTDSLPVSVFLSLTYTYIYIWTHMYGHIHTHHLLFQIHSHVCSCRFTFIYVLPKIHKLDCTHNSFTQKKHILLDMNIHSQIWTLVHEQFTHKPTNIHTILHTYIVCWTIWNHQCWRIMNL